MQALILAGGEGTRLRPLTLTIPKPAIQLVDRPFLRYMLDWLGRHGVDDVVIASGFGAEASRGRWRAMPERARPSPTFRSRSRWGPAGRCGSRPTRGGSTSGSSS